MMGILVSYRFLGSENSIMHLSKSVKSLFTLKSKMAAKMAANT